MKKLHVLAFFMTFFSFNTFAAEGFIVKNATVTKLSATSQNVEAFWLWYTADVDSCQGKIKFKFSNTGAQGIFDRAHTLALSALTNNLKVDVYSYSDSTDCHSAVSVDLHH